MGGRSVAIEGDFIMRLFDEKKVQLTLFSDQKYRETRGNTIAVELEHRLRVEVIRVVIDNDRIVYTKEETSVSGRS